MTKKYVCFRLKVSVLFDKSKRTFCHSKWIKMRRENGWVLKNIMDGDRKKNRAGDGTQTRDPQLGRLMLYQLSYSRLYLSFME